MERVNNYSLEQLKKDYKQVLSWGFGFYLGLNIRQKIPKGLDLGEFLKTEGLELNIGLLKLK